MPATLDERELVRRTLAGDREAFRVIVLQHQQRLAQLVFRQTGDRGGAEDLVQETFLRAFRSLERFDPSYRLSTWLSRIALNVARDLGRRKVVRDNALPRLEPRGPHHMTPLDDAQHSEARQTVLEALEALPEAQREVIVLSVYGGLTHREIAETTGLPLGTVKSRLRSALGKLRDLVAPLRPGGAV